MRRSVTVDRTRLPQPGPPRPFVLPPVEKSVLPSGMRVWSVHHPHVPVVSFVCLIARGAAADPPGKDGLAALTADMLDEGTGDRSAIQIHEDLARLGAQFDTDIGSDAIAVSVTTLSGVADRALALIGDIVARPALREGDCERVRQLRLHRLKQLRDSPGVVADRAFLRLLYGDDPYGHSPIGHELSLLALSVDDVRAFHAAAIEPGAATLIAVGDCDHRTIVKLAAESFAGWAGNAADDLTPAASPVPPVRLAIVPRPHAPQSELRFGHVAAARSTPDYHALALGNAVLGGQFVSRINLNLREDKGFTYGARTSFEFRRRPGPFVLQVSVQTGATGRAIHECIEEIGGIRGPRPITDAELAFGIAALTRGYARNFETADQISRAVMQLALYDLPDDYYAQFVGRVESLTRDTVSQAMAKHLDPARMTTLIVGDPDVIAADLPALGLGEPVMVDRGDW
jgi:predicted Zn-dependent peptidase